jgi:hypothetical protein
LISIKFWVTEIVSDVLTAHYIYRISEESRKGSSEFFGVDKGIIGRVYYFTLLRYGALEYAGE